MRNKTRPVILITGASGLLGKALIQESLKKDVEVLAHYFRHPGDDQERLTWIYGDFSSLRGIKQFQKTFHWELLGCRYLINNYGPMTFKDTQKLEGSDFLADMTGNLVVASEITFSLLRRRVLKSMVSIGYAEAGSIRGFRKILPYALAKNALLDMTRSLARSFPAIRFNMISPVTLKGARHQRQGEFQVDPEKIAAAAVQVLFGRRTGCHFHVRP